MAIENSINERIEKCLNGEMNPAEEAAFRKEKQSNPDLLEKYVTRKKINKAIQKKEVIALRQQLTELFQLKETKILPINQRKFKWFWAAAVVIILIGAGYFLFTYENKDDIDIVVDKNDIEHEINKDNEPQKNQVDEQYPLKELDKTGFQVKTDDKEQTNQENNELQPTEEN